MELILEKIVTDFPAHGFDQKTGKSFATWAEESHQLAIKYAYQNIYQGCNFLGNMLLLLGR